MRSGISCLFRALVMVFMAACLTAAEGQFSGTIRGRLCDADTQAPLVGGNVMIPGTPLGAATDLDGVFEIRKVPVGSYMLKFTYVGYAPVVKTDVIVKSQRTTNVQAETRMQTLETEAVEVTAGYFSQAAEQPVSAVSFDYEEIRRAPGSGGDVSRILMSLPSTAMVNDQSNSLIVRGGNPVENTFFIDNIEIPNINHFPDQATSGGPIGVLNVDFIRNVNFYSGGFSSLYGDKLSSVMDIQFREGNRQEFDAQLDLNFAGFGGTAEGPLGKKGSWLISARRSYLDFIVQTLNVGSTVAPRYGDIQWKTVTDLSPSDRLIFLGVWSDDHNAPDHETGEKNQMSHYGRQDDGVRTTGLTWRRLWGSRGYTNTSLSHTLETYNQDWYETSTGNHDLRNRSLEQSLKFRQVNHLRLNARHLVQFGLDAKILRSDYKNRMNAESNLTGGAIDPVIIEKTLKAFKTGGFISWHWKPVSTLECTAGLRTDYFSLNRIINTSPRFALSYQYSPRIKWTAAVGRFYQNLPLLLLSRNRANASLRDMQSTHVIAGLEYLLTDNTRFTAEVYQKDYAHFPADPSQPGLFLLDEGYTCIQSEITDNGKAQTRGVEIIIQKKLARKVYGLVSASYFRARYRDEDGRWTDRKYDNQWIISAEGGYKPGRQWEFSLRFIAAGGGPYTPMDINTSKDRHRMVLDETKINRNRYPDYHSMNVRMDRRFSFTSTNLIFYLSVWNVYNRKNVAEYYWNDEEQKQDVIYQWLLLPIFGLEYEF